MQFYPFHTGQLLQNWFEQIPTFYPAISTLFPIFIFFSGIPFVLQLSFTHWAYNAQNRGLWG
jgi:hypothetical protein